MAGKYSKSNKSSTDIKDIVKYTIINFGESQADKYLDGLEENLELLANNPNLGKPLTCSGKYPQTDQKYFYYRYLSHVIFYVKREKDILIIRILYKKMLPENYL